MKKTRPFRWYHRLFYRWSSPYRHDVDRGHRWYKALGYTEGYNDCLNHLPWPYEPQTDPLQPALPDLNTLPPGDFRKLVYRQEGRTIHTQVTNAISKVQALAKKEGQKEGQTTFNSFVKDMKKEGQS